MAATLTPNYGWTQPQVGGDPTTWGTELNNDLALIDAQVWSNEQGVVLIGSIMMYGGATPPANWLLCQGQSLATTGTYAALFAIIGYAFGGSGANFTLPNLQANFPVGAGTTYALGAAGGAASVTLSTAQLPAHAHTLSQDPGHTHSVNQSPHAHGDPGHAHGVNDPGHAHGGGVHDGGVRNTGGLPPQAETLGATDGSGTGISIQLAGTNLQAADANISLNPALTGIPTTDNTGSGAAVPTVPPYVGINFIIRYQ